MERVGSENVEHPPVGAATLAVSRWGEPVSIQLTLVREGLQQWCSGVIPAAPLPTVRSRQSKRSPHVVAMSGDVGFQSLREALSPTVPGPVCIR